MRLRLAVAVCLCLAGCGIGKGISPEEHVTERAEQRWRALIDGDFRDAYDFLAPGYRETTPYERYQRRFGTLVAWQTATVTDVRVDQELGRADVTLTLKYRAAVPTGAMIDNARGMRETWLFVDGDWFFSPD
jgi:hypothetical protein